MSTGLIAGIVGCGFVLLLGVWVVITYNGFIRMRNMTKEAWSGIDVQLKRRHDLVGNLVNAVKGYMAHEKDVLEKVTELRARAGNAQTVAEAGQLEGNLSQVLGRLFAVMENYPELKANENVMHLQEQLALLEDELQMSRRYYNANVRDLNTAIESFPSNLIASSFHFSMAEFFEVDNAEERQAPTVQF